MRQVFEYRGQEIVIEARADPQQIWNGGDVQVLKGPRISVTAVRVTHNLSGPNLAAALTKYLREVKARIDEIVDAEDHLRQDIEGAVRGTNFSARDI